MRDLGTINQLLNHFEEAHNSEEDKDVLQSFKGLKSLLFGENKIGDVGVRIITGYLTEITKLQLNSNKFTA